MSLQQMVRDSFIKTTIYIILNQGRFNIFGNLFEF